MSDKVKLRPHQFELEREFSDNRKKTEQEIVTERWQELCGNQKLSRQKLEEQKLKKFRRLVAYAYNYSPYYQSLVDRRGINLKTAVPQDFPVLNKSQLMENFDQIVTDSNITKKKVADFLSSSKNPQDLFLDKYQVVHTSGSTGAPGYFVFNRREWLCSLTQGLRFNPPTKEMFEPRSYAYIGSLTGHNAGISAVNAGILSIGPNDNDIRSYEINEPLSCTAEKLNEFQPEGLGGYTTTLLKLAQMKEEGLVNISPKWIEAMGEPLTIDARSYLKNIFGCDIYYLYGCAEHTLMAITYPADKFMTLYDDDLMCEFCDDSNVITNLINHTLPLIRYQTSDVFNILPNPGSAQPYMLLKSVGRPDVTAFFEDKNGREAMITSLDLQQYFFGVSQFQLRVLNKGEFSFLICPRKDLSAEQVQSTLADIDEWLKNLLKRKHMDNVEFKSILVDDIPVDKQTRKFRLILNNVIPPGT